MGFVILVEKMHFNALFVEILIMKSWMHSYVMSVVFLDMLNLSLLLFANLALLQKKLIVKK